MPADVSKSSLASMAGINALQISIHRCRIYQLFNINYQLLKYPMLRAAIQP
jgi:hypothetical protein